MHVTRVELDNIKSYVHSEFTFERGTTAITGENGAGKTTILEAIAWTLFDHLEYSKDDFLRRGAKKGSVRVTFESDLDERQYTVYRDTGTGYHVHDQGLGLRIAEKKKDVSDFLRLHLGIEPGTDLKALFRSAVGVPQGSFTAEFLLAPNARKASFDRLLKVEEYREGAERLRDTVSLIRERTSEVRERIAGAEGQLARYDELVAEHTLAAARVRELEAAMGELQQEINERARVVELMDQAERYVSETRLVADRLEVERDAALRRASDLGIERDAARAALERQQSARADHLEHLSALDLLRELETKRAARDPLRTEAERVARLLVSATGDVRRLEEALERAARAAQSIAALEPLIVEQEELERERERLRDLRAQAISARERLTQLDVELEHLRAQHTQTRERIREAERGSGAQERVAQLESDRLDVETTLSRMERAATSAGHLQDQRKDAEREALRLQREVARHEKEIADLEKLSERAAEAAQLVARESDLTERLAHLRAEITRDEKFQREVKGGLCPILSERCLNIGEGQTLEDYFTGQFATNRAQLKAMEKERAELSVAVREAREAEKHLSRLESAEHQLKSERKLLAERQGTLARLERELAALPDASRERLQQLKFQLFGIDAELKDQREAALRFAELQPLQQRLKEIEQEGKRRKEERDGVAAAAEAVTTLEKDIEETDARLRRLKDPRASAASLRAEAESAPARQAELSGATDALRALEEQSRTLNRQLEQYKGLDTQWEEARERRDRTAPAHHEYVASESLAAQLPAREAELARAEEQAARGALEAENARREHETATHAYDREQHNLERAGLAQARERGAATSAQLEAARVRESSLGAEIERLREVRDQMREEFRAKERLEELNEATDFIRDILKQAGPLVTESYLYNISIEANQLFREITGEAGRALRWSRDYEIILEEEGHERSFPNLSGGEQMAAALSIRLALLKQLSDIRLAFFDEPTVNMDQERRERLAQQIGQVQHFDQLFVISHDDTFEENVDHILHIKGRDEGNQGMKDEG
ncbi:MAG TPA: SMC family ATPase [Pyrinomonadaceae bacterium]|jgi:exonuclease SbcC